jgi:hypothetical protein
MMATNAGPCDSPAVKYLSIGRQRLSKTTDPRVWNSIPPYRAGVNHLAKTAGFYSCPSIGTVRLRAASGITDGEFDDKARWQPGVVLE